MRIKNNIYSTFYCVKFSFFDFILLIFDIDLSKKSDSNSNTILSSCFAVFSLLNIVDSNIEFASSFKLTLLKISSKTFDDPFLF